MGHRQSRLLQQQQQELTGGDLPRRRSSVVARLDDTFDLRILQAIRLGASSTPEDEEYDNEEMNIKDGPSSEGMVLQLSNPFPSGSHVSVTSIASSVKSMLHRDGSFSGVKNGRSASFSSGSSSSASEGDMLKASGSVESAAECNTGANGSLMVREEDQAEFFYDCGKRLLLGKEGGMEVARDAPRAVCLLLRAAELGHRGAQWDLQCCTGTGDDIRLDYAKAVAMYKRHAQKKDPVALSNLGVCYHKGRGVPLSLSKAARYYQQAADLNYSRGNYNLGVCYDLGEGVTQSVAKAVEHYNKAAQLGYAVAQYYMGVCQQHSKGLAKADLRRAIDLWRKAALQGHALAQSMLGTCFKDGVGLEKDILMAAHLYLAATAWGDAKAWIKLKDVLACEVFEGCTQGSTENGNESDNENENKETNENNNSTNNNNSNKTNNANNNTYHVATLYDQCCMHFHRKWSSYEMDTQMPVLQSLLPSEVTERIKYLVNKCIHPSCNRVFYGSGRVERRFRLKATHMHTCPSACSVSGGHRDGSSCDGGCVWDSEKDVVLSYCSIHCSQLE